MTRHVNTNTPLQDLSLRFCSCCLKQFCPKPEQFQSETVRFFVPTIDALSREHFAYIEASKKFIESLYGNGDKLSLNLAEHTQILHIEIGTFPSLEREQEIISFYNSAQSITAQAYNQLAA